MSQSVIDVRGLGKAYRLGKKPPTHNTLGELVTQAFRAPLARRRALSEATDDPDVFWALKDVGFQVRQGDVLGLIGRNGAGKSTLLKILSRITEPTAGRAILRGRVASLLEVGTGFHAELTGRENIYLNGSILGMRKAEIDRKFDEIVDFSEVEDFLDTPVKRYSSGMYVRLAFAVAAHLDPEILIVDEVLAVGDAQFQKKCLGKMQEVSTGQGRTVLFVSHNMSAVQNLCSRALLLRKGRVVMDDTADAVVREYLSHLSGGAETAFTDNPERTGNGMVRMTGARLLNEIGQETRRLEAGKPATIEVDYRNVKEVRKAVPYMTVINHLGVAVTSLDLGIIEGCEVEVFASGRFSCRLPRVPLPLGEYRIVMGINVEGQVADLVPNGLVFEVESSSFFQTHRSPNIRWCTAMLEQKWDHTPVPDAVAAVVPAGS